MITKTIFEKNNVTIIREQSYGFRCNSLSTMWYVYADGKLSSSFSRLKKAKEWAENLLSN